MGSNDNKRTVTLIVIAVILYSFFSGIGDEGGVEEGGGGTVIV